MMGYYCQIWQKNLSECLYSVWFSFDVLLTFPDYFVPGSKLWISQRAYFKSVCLCIYATHTICERTGDLFWPRFEANLTKKKKNLSFMMRLNLAYSFSTYQCSSETSTSLVQKLLLEAYLSLQNISLLITGSSLSIMSYFSLYLSC